MVVVLYFSDSFLFLKVVVTNVRSNYLMFSFRVPEVKIERT